LGINRLTGIVEKVIRPTQSTFMPGRHILDGVLILHDTIHELHRKKLNGVWLKLDFENHMIRLGGLSFNKFFGLRAFIESGVNGLINDFISRGSVGIKVNDDISHHFQT
jgi:hypothetical protein